MAPLIAHGGEKVPDSYIVKLLRSVNKTQHLASFPWLLRNVKYASWSSDLYHGYAGRFDPEQLAQLLSSPDVESVEEDGVVQPEVAPLLQ